jgi:hypothetical protein
MLRQNICQLARSAIPGNGQLHFIVHTERAHLFCFAHQVVHLVCVDLTRRGDEEGLLRVADWVGFLQSLQQVLRRMKEHTLLLTIP